MGKDNIASLLLGTLKSRYKEMRGRHKVNKKYIDRLGGGGVMGQDNYNEAAKTIKAHTKSGNYAAARKYLVEQLKKLKEQTKGTGSEGYYKDKLKEMGQK